MSFMEKRFVFRGSESLMNKIKKLSEAADLGIIDIFRLFLIEGIIKHRNTKPEILQQLAFRAHAVDELNANRDFLNSDLSSPGVPCNSDGTHIDPFSQEAKELPDYKEWEKQRTKRKEEWPDYDTRGLNPEDLEIFYQNRGGKE